MTRFTSQQIDQFLNNPTEEHTPSLTQEQLTQNEEQIISRIHSHNVRRRTGWLTAAASVMLIVVAGITVHNHKSHFAANTTDDTFHALYEADENTSAEELENQETLIECDTFLEFV